MRDRAWVTQFVQRAEKAGYSALCLTVDLPVKGVRERDIHTAYKLPANCTMINYGKAPEDFAASTAVCL